MMQKHSRDNQDPACVTAANIAEIDGGDPLVLTVGGAIDTLMDDQHNNRLLVGVSGGVDSVVLLAVLMAAVRVRCLDVSIYIAHADHGLREESAADADFVACLADRLNIGCVCSRIDVAAEAKKRGIGLELAARDCRYNFLGRCAEDFDCDYIALAHHRGDQAETILHRILRGTGINSLAAMRPARNFDKNSHRQVIRPMLDIDRAEIEKFAARWQLSWRHDSSNSENIYTRNKIRNELLPFLRENFNPSVDDALIRLGRNAADAAETLSQVAGKDFAEMAEFDADSESRRVSFNYELVKKLPRGRFCELVRLALQKLGCDGQKITQDNIFSALSAPAAGGVQLTAEIRAAISGDKLIISDDAAKLNNTKQGPSELGDLEKFELTVPGECRLSDGKTISADIVDLSEAKCAALLKKLKKNPTATFANPRNVEYFDLEKIPAKIFIRHRAAGDKFTPLGLRGSKKLKDLFNSLSVPPRERNKFWLACSADNEIYWLCKLRPSNKAKLSPRTRRAVRLEIKD